MKNFDFLSTDLPPGLSVIEASAGTGKTYAISHLVPRLLLEKQVEHIGQIVLVTYTNDAVRELSSRVRQVLTRLAATPTHDETTAAQGVAALRAKYSDPEHRKILQRALLDFDRLQVSTIHSFCQRILQTEDVLCGCPGGLELVPDISGEWSTLAAEWWCREIAPDAFLTGLASSCGWSREEVAHAARLLWKENGEVDWIPAPPPWPQALADVQGAAARWREKVDLPALRAVLEPLNEKGWNQGHTLATIEETFLAPLDPKNLTDEAAGKPGFWQALGALTNLHGLVNKQSKDRKKLAQDLEKHAALELARELLALLPLLQWALIVRGAEELGESLRLRLRDQGAVTYDGLIHTVRQALRGPRGDELAARLRERQRVILIDESQDTEAAQFEIFQRVFLPQIHPEPPCRMVLIGDPKQSIYAFRGADVNTYLQARVQAGKEVFTLTETYRAPAALVAATNALFARPLSLARPGLDCPPAVSKLAGDWALVAPQAEAPSARATVWWLDDDAGLRDMHNAGKATLRLARAVAGEISHLLREGFLLRRTSSDGTVNESPLQPRDIAVLCNAHQEAEKMRQMLLQQGVPARRAGSGDILHTEEAEELVPILRALHQPRHRRLRRAALLTRLLGVGLADLTETGGARAGEDAWLERFLEWQQLWMRSGLAAALAAIDQTTKLQQRLAAMENGERRLSNWRQLVDLLQQQSLAHPGRITPVLHWLDNARADSSSDPPEERLQQLESEAEAVQILTMHSAKGLEFPLVFLPFAWKSGHLPPLNQTFLRRPHQGLPRIVRGPLADKAEWQAARRDLLEDRLRLLYVACTRAQVALWLVAGQTSGKVSPPCGPLDWILRRTDATENPVEPPEEWWENVASFGRGTRHAEGWDEILAGLPQSDPPPWRRVPLPWAELPPPWQPPDQTDAESPDAWQVLPMPTIRDPWRFTSFSALTREKHPHSDAPPEMPHTTLPAPAPLSSGAWNRFRDVPGGTLVGSAVHDWLEAWDFAVLDRNALRAHLRDYALPGGEEKWVAPVGDMLEELREVTLPGLGTDVSRACPDPRASEWHFQLPLDGPLEAEPLAAVFARHGETDYAESLAALPVGQIQGYLHGFLDRLAVWNGSWGVIDWKTNQLGPEDSAYDPPALLAAARASHYVLQTHLYLIALRRFLGPTVPLRGAWLIYLRGISPGTPRGVCPIEPSPGLLDDLDRLFLPPQK